VITCLCLVEFLPVVRIFGLLLGGVPSVQRGSCVRFDASARKKSLPPGSLLAAAVDVGLGVRARRFWERFLAETAPP